MGLLIAPRQGAILWVNVGCSVVTNEYNRSVYAKVREAIELLFGVVSQVSLGIGILDGVHFPQKGGMFGGYSGPFGVF